MNIMPDELLEKLRACGAHIKTTSPLQGSVLHVRVNVAALKQSASVLRNAGLYPVFMTAVHTDPHVALVYQFAAWNLPLRILLATTAPPDGHAPSLSSLFPGLQWHEREARDMFGITFDGHPDLRPLLLPDEDRDLHPLRKGSKNLKTLEQLRGSDLVSTDGESHG
jgi:NADH-quinone oxidoreductase subunit C